ncbi:hypothetical protein PEL8287_00528 [Roseovarius litorisediminis]|uniref:Lipoprotein n=1 Tax=Roseovarius litorisediminis TaxID=1312363 RepID=A0A1Y5RBE3_9RHOB|nr:hypothetical protein [Roseovarius litorisediminis]SLN13497.1 hypothetical protein PEL8287_00528 [Roseovarius litorisediminis]
MKILSLIAILMSGMVLSACAQQEEPAPMVVEPEPVYDKYGNPV